MGMTTNAYDPWREYDTIAEHCASLGLSGDVGTTLPDGIGGPCMDLINADPEAFAERVRDCAYARAMNRHNLPED